MLAHAYISTPCEVTNVLKNFKDVPLDYFIMKAVSKAFRDTINKRNLSISRVHSQSKKENFNNTNNINLSKFAQSPSEAALEEQLITIHNWKSSAESFAICEEPALLSVHFTQPKQEVIFNSNQATIDIAADNDKETGMPVTFAATSKEIRIAQITNVSISYDVAKIDDLRAALFISRV